MKELNGSLRLATPEDLDAVLALDRATPVGRERSEYLAARVHAGEVVIFERDGRLLGYVVHRTNSFFGRDFVDLLAVAVDSRRQGVASALLEMRGRIVVNESYLHLDEPVQRSDDRLAGEGGLGIQW